MTGEKKLGKKATNVEKEHNYLCGKKNQEKF